jgi:preprotein translocase subunit SecE
MCTNVTVLGSGVNNVPRKIVWPKPRFAAGEFSMRISFVVFIALTISHIRIALCNTLVQQL